MLRQGPAQTRLPLVPMQSLLEPFQQVSVVSAENVTRLRRTHKRPCSHAQILASGLGSFATHHRPALYLHTAGWLSVHMPANILKLPVHFLAGPMATARCAF